MKVYIPIKENSQRVPGKNLRDFGGVPLYQYVLNKWVNFGVPVWVDTDSKEIYEWVTDNKFDNISSYMRPEGLVGDSRSVNDLIFNFISTVGLWFDNEVIAQIHVTSPFLKPETVMDQLDWFGLGFNSVCSASRINSRLWIEGAGGHIPLNHNPMSLLQTQDLPTVLAENSAFYMMLSNRFVKTRNRISDFHKFVEINEIESMDIDTEEDWRRCNEVLVATNS